jgi:hypothetical protein
MERARALHLPAGCGVGEVCRAQLEFQLQEPVSLGDECGGLKSIEFWRTT